MLVSVYLFRNSWSTFARGPSEVVGGIPGFYVIDNLWYHDKTFCESMAHIYRDSASDTYPVLG